MKHRYFKRMMLFTVALLTIFTFVSVGGPQASAQPPAPPIPDLDALLEATSEDEGSEVAAKLCDAGKGPVKVLFRTDSRGPREIARQGGFYPRGWQAGQDFSLNRVSLAEHVKGSIEDDTKAPSDSGYISTTCDPQAAQRIARSVAKKEQEDVWLYQIAATPDAINVDLTLGASNPHPDEREYANLGPINWDSVQHYKRYSYQPGDSSDSDASSYVASESSDDNLEYDADKYQDTAATSQGAPLLDDTGNKRVSCVITNPEDENLEPAAKKFKQEELRKKRAISSDNCEGFDPQKYIWAKRIIDNYQEFTSSASSSVIQLGGKGTLYNRCIDAGKAPGEAYIPTCANANPNQLWSYDKTTRLIKNSNKKVCLAVDVSSVRRGYFGVSVGDIRTKLKDCSAQDSAQKWTFTSEGGLTPDFTPVQQPLYLMVASGDLARDQLRFTNRPDFNNPVTLWTFKN